MNNNGDIAGPYAETDFAVNKRVRAMMAWLTSETEAYISRHNYAVGSIQYENLMERLAGALRSIELSYKATGLFLPLEGEIK